jgi:hypothetical protein
MADPRTPGPTGSRPVGLVPPGVPAHPRRRSPTPGQPRPLPLRLTQRHPPAASGSARNTRYVMATPEQRGWITSNRARAFFLRQGVIDLVTQPGQGHQAAQRQRCRIPRGRRSTADLGSRNAAGASSQTALGRAANALFRPRDGWAVTPEWPDQRLGAEFSVR